MESIQDFINYRKQIEEKSESNSKEVFDNSDIVHALMVFTELFKKAKRDRIKEVNMFCGGLYILRDSAEQQVNKVLDGCEDRQNDEEKKKFNPCADLREAIDDYLSNGGKLKVIMEKQSYTGFRNESIMKELWHWLSEGAIKIMKSNFVTGLNHFTVTGDSIRLEYDEKGKKAVCCFNADGMKKYFDMFSDLWKDSSEFCVLR